MTNTILEIIRHHENPCAVLTRPYPRFEPFDLEVTLNYATTAQDYGRKRLQHAIVMAACNAHSQTLHWQLMSDPFGHLTHLNLSQPFGWSKPALQVTTIQLNDRGRWSHFTIDYLPQYRTDGVYLTLDPADSGVLEQVYPTALQLGMETYGIPPRHHEDTSHGTIITTHNIATSAYLFIPFYEFARAIKHFESLVLGQQIVINTGGSLRAGPLAIEAFNHLNLPLNLMGQWLNPFAR